MIEALAVVFCSGVLAVADVGCVALTVPTQMPMLSVRPHCDRPAHLIGLRRRRRIRRSDGVGSELGGARS